jgi:long-chain acyl-CoA synthetase
MTAPIDSSTLALQRLYHWERTEPERIAYTQPLGGGQVVTYNWRRVMSESPRMAAYL